MDDMKQIMLDFVTFLQQQSPNLGNCKQSLQELKQQFQPDDDPYEISQKIIEWYKKYPEIEAIFNNTDWDQVRCDMVEPDQEVPGFDLTLNVDRVTNRMIIQAIDDFITNSPESSQTPTNNEENENNDE